MGPLPLIHGPAFDNISKSYFVWSKILFLTDSQEIYVAHTYFLLFYFLWFFGFFYVWRFRYRGPVNVLDFNYSKLSWLILLYLPLMLFVICVYIVQSSVGIFRIGAIYGSGVELITQRYGAVFKALVSLLGSSIICFSAIFFIYSKRNKRIINRYTLVFLAYFFGYIIFSFVTGDTSQLFVLLIGVFLLWGLLYNRTFISFKLIFYFIFCAFIFVIIRALRGLAGGSFSPSPEFFIKLLTTPFFSVESFAAYASLPVLIIEKSPLIWGGSFIALFLSFFPRFILSWRPNTGFVYPRYVEILGIANVAQGFTFHHVADWYWNFSWLGVIVGGFLIGYLMAKVERKAFTSNNIFWAIAFSSLMGHIPVSLRAPIEGIKAIFYEYWFLPFMVFIVLPFFTGRVRIKR